MPISLVGSSRKQFIRMHFMDDYIYKKSNKIFTFCYRKLLVCLNPNQKSLMVNSIQNGPNMSIRSVALAALAEAA